MKTLPLPPESPSFATRMSENSVWNAVAVPFISVGKKYLSSTSPSGFAPTMILLGLLTIFLSAGTLLRAIDPVAGILDIGILSVLLFGLLGGAVAIFVSLWLQEMLWRPFKLFRQRFQSHFNQLTSWQQSILYFSVLFLLLYAALWALAIVF